MKDEVSSRMIGNFIRTAEVGDVRFFEYDDHRLLQQNAHAYASKRNGIKIETKLYGAVSAKLDHYLKLTRVEIFKAD